jgi:2-desacetyl-2-hydroxyethyl bacteriochlorophyllide A dehydrogenase
MDRSRATGLWFPRAREVEFREEPMAPPGPGQVRLRAIASGISQGTEMLVFRGQVPPGMPLDLPTLEGAYTFPIKYGYASVGRVLEVGPGVEGIAEGDAAFVLHPHQNEYVVPVDLVTVLPRGIDPILGVFVANLETAVNVLLDANPRLGERVVVFGQGVVGLLVTQLLRRVGVGAVIAVEPSEYRRSLSSLAGADVVLPPSPELPGQIRDLTDGLGADLVIEASGNGAALAQALDCVAAGGTIVAASWYGAKEVTLPLGGAFHRGRLRIVSSQVGTVDPALQPRWTARRRMDVALSLLPTLTLQPFISHRIAFAGAASAYELVDRRPEETAQVVLTY